MTTERLLVAVPELRRMAPDALRMVGLPIGQADETADMFVWTEAVTGRALRFLRLNRNRMLWSPRARLGVVRERQNEVVLDARGGSLLECGIRVVDFACGEAARQGSSMSVVLENTHGSLFLEYLVWRSAVRGFRVRASVAGGGQEPADVEPLSGVRFHVAAAEEDAPRLPGSYRAARDNGLMVMPDDFTSFSELFEMLRVPTSERSRSHAG